MIGMPCSEVCHCIIYGENRDALHNAMQRGGREHTLADDLQAAVWIAATLAQRGDTVLLAPAAASQDAFTDYQERGRKFAQWVHEVAS